MKAEEGVSLSSVVCVPTGKPTTPMAGSTPVVMWMALDEL